MAVPDFQSLMLPLLRLVGDGLEHAFKDAVEAIAEEFKLTEEERQELLPSSSRTTLFYNRLAWAKTHMTMAGLLQGARRGVFCISSSLYPHTPPHHHTRGREGECEGDMRPSQL